MFRPALPLLGREQYNRVPQQSSQARTDVSTLHGHHNETFSLAGKIGDLDIVPLLSMVSNDRGRPVSVRVA